MPTASTTPPPLEGNLALQLWALSDAFHRHLAAELQPMGISIAGFRMVGELIAEPEGVRIGTLAQRLDLKAPTVSVMVDRFEALGLVERVPDPKDARAARVRLAARAPLAEGIAVLSRIEQRLLDGMTDEARTALSTQLSQLIQRLDSGTSPS